jgi:V/A-type H+-transporting ATPase subunit E
MAEELQSLIDKIQREGINQAKEKARSIEEEADKRAACIIKEAEWQAQQLIDEAREKNRRHEESGKEMLAQAGRDMILALRQRINAMLQELIAESAKKALSCEDSARIISRLIMGQAKDGRQDILILANHRDIEGLKHALSKEFGELLKKGINIAPQDQIRHGFFISFDSGKSSFEFTDKALAEYIFGCLKPQLEGIFKAAKL